MMTRKTALVSRRVIRLTLGLCIVIVAVVVGFDVGDVREQLLWKISPPAIRGIAALPFKNLSNDPEQAYISQAMTTNLSADMQHLADLRVIAITSVTHYRDAPKPLPVIARELNIDAVVEGGVLRLGGRVRISANLTHAPTDHHMWGHTYEGGLGEIPSIRAELIRDIAREINARLTSEGEIRLTSRRPVNPQAYEFYLRGAGAVLGDGAKREAYFKRAIQLDPSSAAPYYDYLAQMYFMRTMSFALAPREVYPKTREAAQKALRLDPTIEMSHRILGSVALEYDWNFAEAEKEFKLQLERVPNGPWAHHMYAHFLLAMGRMDEAAAESRRAIELNPLGPTLLDCVSWHEIAAHNYDEAEKRALQALSLGAPDQFARLTLGWSYALRSRHNEAIPEFQKAVVGWQNAVFPTAALGQAYAVAGQESAAREILNRLLARSKTEYVSPYEIAVIFAGLGDRDRAFEWLDKAYEERATPLVYFRMDPRIWGLRSDARFQDLLRRMNFPQDRRN
jgi:TolB-like protein/Tfp pilus assembly protein PilF